MKRIFLAAALCLLAATTTEATEYWRGLATNHLGLFVLTLPQQDEASALADAKARCILGSTKDEQESCDESIAAPLDWYLVGIYCSNGYDDDYHLATFVADGLEEFNEAVSNIILKDEGWFDPKNCGLALVSPPMQSIPE